MNENIILSAKMGIVKAPSIKKLAKWVNENSDCVAKVEHIEGIVKDTKVGHSRLRRPGRIMYSGNILTIYDKNGEQKFRHDTTETYRNNNEVCYWIVENIINKEKVKRVLCRRVEG